MANLFVQQSWHCNNNNNCENYFKNDQNAFIFSMINQRNKSLKMSRESIYCHNDFGPVFGNDDFYIVDKSNTNAKSCSKLVNSYAHPDYARNSKKSKSFLAGTPNFKVSKIEVYTQDNKTNIFSFI